MQFKSIISIVKTSILHWQSHRAARMGAALSYYTIFSIVPQLILILFLIGPILGNSYIQEEVVKQVQLIVNTQSANLVQSILIGINEVKFNLYTIIIGIGMLIMGTLGVFYELKSSIDDLWDTNKFQKEKRGWRQYFLSHLLSLSMIPILGFLLLISILFSSILSYLSGYSKFLLETTLLYQILSFGFSFIILSFLFTFIYRFLPVRKLPWRELIRGAIVTSVLFLIGKFLIGLYITHLSGVSLFGAAEAFIILLLWVFYSVQIFLFGASFTYIYSRRYGHLKQD